MCYIIIFIASFAVAAVAVWVVQLLKPTSESLDDDTELVNECELQPEQPKDDRMQRVIEYKISGEELIYLLREAGFHLPEDVKNVDVFHFVYPYRDDCLTIHEEDPILVRFEETAPISGTEFRNAVVEIPESDGEFTMPGSCEIPSHGAS